MSNRKYGVETPVYYFTVYYFNIFYINYYFDMDANKL